MTTARTRKTTAKKAAPAARKPAQRKSAQTSRLVVVARQSPSETPVWDAMIATHGDPLAS